MLMQCKIVSIPNSMVRKTALPDRRLSPANSSKLVRITSLDELDSALDGYTEIWGKQQMNVVRHHDKCVKEVASLATIVIESLKEHSNV